MKLWVAQYEIDLFLIEMKIITNDSEKLKKSVVSFPVNASWQYKYVIWIGIAYDCTQFKYIHDISN